MNLLVLPRYLLGCALGVLVFAFAFAATPAWADVTIGLTGGVPHAAIGQRKIAAAGVGVMSWAGNQTPVNPLIPALSLRVGMKTALELPALNATYWTTQDEPWLNGVGPAFIQQQVDVIHAAGGTALTNQGWSMDTRRWPSVAELAAYPGDVLSVDSYPTAAHPYAEIGAKVALLHRAAGGRPVWAALQVCSRSNFATGRVPSAAAEWEMAKRALNAGATGIMFFGSSYKACFRSALDSSSGFNWSAWLHTVSPTIARIHAYEGTAP
jgi:hypothetical protein